MALDDIMPSRTVKIEHVFLNAIAGQELVWNYFAIILIIVLYASGGF